MLRDKNKDSLYFKTQKDKYIAYLEEDMEELSSIKKEHLRSLKIGLYQGNLRLTKICYSLGDSPDTIYSFFKEALTFFKDVIYEGSSLYNLMDYFSLAVLFSERKEEFLDDLKEVYDKMTYTDGALECFASYLFYDRIEPFHSTFEYLNMIGDDVDSVKKAQGFWYYDHSDAPWYDSHLRDRNSYDGYWSWDTAALCKIRGIFSPELKELDYFPYDLLVQE